MSQGSLVIPTTGTLSGLQLVNAINDAVDNLVTNASGSTDPSTLSGGVKPYSFWLDTSVSPNVLRMRNASNTNWASIGTISANNFIPNLEFADISTALGYTPVNKAGDTMTGTLNGTDIVLTGASQAAQIKATSKFVFPDNTEQTSAAVAEFSTGTVMLFVQSTAPTGWTKSTAHNDKALRVVSGSVSSGGIVSFSNAFKSGQVSDGTTLSSNQIGSHSHGINLPVYGSGGSDTYQAAWTARNSAYLGYYNASSEPAGGGQAHSHSLPSFAVQYVDVIICTRN